MKEWFIELDPETDLPRKVCGNYAIHCDSRVIMVGDNLSKLESICQAHNRCIKISEKELEKFLWYGFCVNDFFGYYKNEIEIVAKECDIETGILMAKKLEEKYREFNVHCESYEDDVLIRMYPKIKSGSSMAKGA